MLNQNFRLGVIPARWASTRFPNKVLAKVGGKYLVQRVWEAAQQSSLLDEVLIATDSLEVVQAAKGFGAKAVMTPASLPSGTDRVFYASQGIEADTIVNLQGDEPLLEAGAIDALIQGLEGDSRCEMATLCVYLENAEEKRSPNVVKIQIGSQGLVEDFSRSAFPGEGPGFLKHLGVYAFKREALRRFCGLGVSEREKAERLEQLRALSNGMGIKAVVWPRDTIAVDVPGDVARVESVLRERERGL